MITAFHSSVILVIIVHEPSFKNVLSLAKVIKSITSPVPPGWDAMPLIMECIYVLVAFNSDLVL